jgi:hypothetical protein
MVMEGEVTFNADDNVEMETDKVVEEDDIVELGKESTLMEMDEYEREWREKEKEKELQKREIGRARKEIEIRQTIEAPVSNDKQNDTPHSPTPPRHPPSRILHVEHLKRPFTILQLKTLLQEDGSMVDGGFWTNKIKSHCIAIFPSTDVAKLVRSRLHGLKWPSTNPQRLRVDFLSSKEVVGVSEGELIVDEGTSPLRDEAHNPPVEDNQEGPPEEVAPITQGMTSHDVM